MPMPEPTTEERLFEFPCDTPGCENKYWAPKSSRRRFCDECLVKRVTGGKKTDHEKLVNWLAANKADIWTAPFIEVAKVVKDHGGSQ